MNEEARNSICPECGSYHVTYEHTDNYDWQLCICGRCGCSGTPDEFFHNSVFARITSSPEVLAEKLVYPTYGIISRTWDFEKDDWGTAEPSWSSAVKPDLCYVTKEEAIAATVAKLKEVKNE